MSKPSDKVNGGTVLLPEEVIKHIPLSDIFVDYEWNIRSKAQILSDSSDAVQDTTIRGEHHGEGTGFVGLALNMYATGQDTPVVLRRVEGGKSLAGKKTDRPYELVCGFRRYTAVEKLNDKEFFAKLAEDNKEGMAERKDKTLPTVPNTANGSICAVVRALDKTEARMLNAKENTLRDNLTTPDMVRFVADRLRHDKMTQSQIASALGIGQPYVSRLARISNLPAIVVAHWRGEKVTIPGLPDAIQKRLTSREMSDLADMVKDETEGAAVVRYVEILNPPPSDGEGGQTSDPVAKRVREFAFLCGVMVRAGILMSGSLHWSRVIGPKKEGYPIDSGKADAPKRGEYWDLAEKAFEDGLEDPEKAAKKAKKTPEEKQAAKDNQAAS